MPLTTLNVTVRLVPFGTLSCGLVAPPVVTAPERLAPVEPRVLPESTVADHIVQAAPARVLQPASGLVGVTSCQ